MPTFIRRPFRVLFCVSLISVMVAAQPQAALSPDLQTQIATIAREALASTGVPSASIAIVQDGKISYLQAYGQARIDPPTPARSDMRYSIGSISKQFTAAAILLLAEQGKLSLDDPVSRFVPDLTRGRETTIRQILSHTSGYQDFWPQDYVPPFMLQPITADKILDLWARKPLDFDPGTQWQYSNTNFVIAGLIVEKASGMPLLDFLSKYIFAPLNMRSVMNIDQNRLTETDPIGYLRYALGPPRVAPKEGKGWLFAAGELAMPAEDLAKWDISIINQTVLRPASYREMETEVVLKNGLGTRYGLGVSVRQESGRRAIEHGGEVSGFTAHNMVFPMNASPWSFSPTRILWTRPARSPAKLRHCCSHTTTPASRNSNPVPSSRGCNRARSTVRCLPSMPTVTSPNKRWQTSPAAWAPSARPRSSPKPRARIVVA